MDWRYIGLPIKYGPYEYMNSFIRLLKLPQLVDIEYLA